MDFARSAKTATTDHNEADTTWFKDASTIQQLYDNS